MSWIVGVLWVVGFFVGLVLVVLGCMALIKQAHRRGVVAGVVFLCAGLLFCIWNARSFNYRFLLSEDGKAVAEMRTRLTEVRNCVNDVERLQASLEERAKPIVAELKEKGLRAGDLRAAIPDDPATRTLVEKLAVLGHSKRRCEAVLRDLQAAASRYEGIIFYQETRMGMKSLADMDELTVPAEVVLDEVKKLTRTPEDSSIPLPKFSEEDREQAASWME